MERRVDPRQSARIDRMGARKPEPVPGLAIAVIKDRKVVHLAGYGSADLEPATPITPQTQFHMASCGKQFTALGWSESCSHWRAILPTGMSSSSMRRWIAR